MKKYLPYILIALFLAVIVFLIGYNQGYKAVPLQVSTDVYDSTMRAKDKQYDSLDRLLSLLQLTAASKDSTIQVLIRRSKQISVNVKKLHNEINISDNARLLHLADSMVSTLRQYEAEGY